MANNLLFVYRPLTVVFSILIVVNVFISSFSNATQPCSSLKMMQPVSCHRHCYGYFLAALRERTEIKINCASFNKVTTITTVQVLWFRRFVVCESSTVLSPSKVQSRLSSACPSCNIARSDHPILRCSCLGF